MSDEEFEEGLELQLETPRVPPPPKLHLSQREDKLEVTTEPATSVSLEGVVV